MTKLYTMQVELNNLMQQVALLNAELPELQNQAVSYGQYLLNSNQQDRSVRNKYNILCRRINTVQKTIQRSYVRMAQLRRQIAVEQQNGYRR